MPESPQPPVAGKADILAAATDLFAESGFDAVSISVIATRAGTSKANVFHHFGSKEALYLEVMRAACGRFADTLARLGDDSAPFGQRLTEFVREDLAQMRAEPDCTHLILREVLESGPCRGRALAGEVFHDQFDQIVDLFRRGQGSGQIAADVPPALAATVLIACNVFLFQSQHVLRHLPGVDFVDDPDRYARLVGRVLLEGIGDRNGADGGGSKGES